MNPVYLDCNATTPLDPRVLEVLTKHFSDEYGNEGSRTHLFGTNAKRAVQAARSQVANAVSAKAEEVTFTSGATESNNIAILGLQEASARNGKRHIITTSIEHKAVLEPLQELARRGFEVTHLPVGSGGRVDPEDLRASLRVDTLLVSIMHANNETGIVQPLDDLADVLGGHPAYFHTDASQTFGKEPRALKNPRIDLISVSGHKIFGPKGVGALICRKRGLERVPLAALTFGGGQERGLRAGTLPVPLIAALGEAAHLAIADEKDRRERCHKVRAEAESALASLGAVYTGDQAHCQAHVINVSIPGLDSEAFIVATKDLIAISNGSACTSSSYSPSHVLIAMGMSEAEATSCVRISWSHLTPDVDWHAVAERVASLI